MRKILVIALLAILGASACSLLPTRTIFVCPEVPDIARPVVPSVDRARLDDIDTDTISVLADRERLIVAYTLELEAVLDAIRDECED